MHDGMGKGITFVDGCCMCGLVIRVHDNAGGVPRCIKEQHGLNGHIHAGVLKVPIIVYFTSLWVLRFGGGLSQKHQVLLMAYTQLTVEGMVPDLLHIILVGHNALLDRVI